MKKVLFLLLAAAFGLTACEKRKTREEIEAEFARFTDVDSDTLLDMAERRSNRMDDASSIQGKTIEDLKREEEAKKRKEDEERRAAEAAALEAEENEALEPATEPEQQPVTTPDVPVEGVAQ